MERLKNYGKAKLKAISISKKNETMGNIFNLIMRSSSFLILGHSYSDVDCISSMLAISLLLRKFNKYVTMYVKDRFPSSVSFFKEICEYNEISLLVGTTEELEKPDVIFILDTPKPEMIALDENILNFFLQKYIPKIEIDHHFSKDARHSGDPPYSLTLRASSSCEIIAWMCQKLVKHTNLLEKYGISDIYSRNIVMVMVAGMMGDAKMGNYLSTKRDISFYHYFLNKFDNILHKSHYKGSKNIGSVEEVLHLLEEFSKEEISFYNILKQEVKYEENIGILLLDECNSYKLQNKAPDFQLFIDIIRRLTGDLSDFPNEASVSCFYYPTSISSFVEFRVRAGEQVKGVDFRCIIEKLQVPEGNGGGHPGAICFKVDRNSITDIKEYMKKMLKIVISLIKTHKEKVNTK